MWNERAEFDIYRNQITESTPHGRHFFDRSVSVNHHFSCIFCQTPLDLHQTMSTASPSILALSSNLNHSSTSNPLTPMKTPHRSSQPTSAGRSSASSSTFNSDTVSIGHLCSPSLSRLSSLADDLLEVPSDSASLLDLHDEPDDVYRRCLVRLRTVAWSAVLPSSPVVLFTLFSSTDKHTLMSSQWFTWCRLCRHGGHAEHVSNWFAMNHKCPIAKCLCRCTLIDGIFC